METPEATEKRKTVWKCKVEGCKYTAPPTLEGYRKLRGHQMAHVDLPKAKRGIVLVDETTGEVLAKKPDEATERGFLAPGPPKLQPKPEPPPGPAPEEKPQPKPEPPPSPPATEQEPEEVEKEPEEVPEAELEEEGEVKGKGETAEPQVDAFGILRYTVTLPADAFTLFNMAKVAGLEKSDKVFDVWLWDCVRKRFEKDYKMQVVLAGIAEE